MRRVILFVNGKLGLNITRYLEAQPEFKIVGVVVNSPEKQAKNFISEMLEISPTLQIFEHTENLWNQPKLKNVIKNSNLAVSALFGHLIPAEVVEFFGSNLINLHPSLLPTGRGADPIAWAIIEQKKQGVTIHVVEKTLDSGPIICQSEIPSDFGMNAGEVYELAMHELERLFIEILPNWPKRVNPERQVGEPSLHQAHELKALRAKILQGDLNLEHTLRIIQALTFADGRTPKLRLSNGELWEISLRMSKVEE
jgi:methionyl-tRNA formyltransferase